MKHKRIIRTVILAASLSCGPVHVTAQTERSGPQQQLSTSTVVAEDSLSGFDEARVRDRAAEKGLSAYESELFVGNAKRSYIQRTFYPSQFQTRNQQLANANRLALLNPTPQAPCTNMGFETGDFTGWTGAVGENTLNSTGPLQNIVPGIQTTGVDALISDMNSRHTIVTAASGNDPCGGFPMVAPGGNYSVRLGNTYGYYQGEILEQTFTVGPGNSAMSYQYAFVLLDGGHSAGEEPYFRVEMLDQSGNLIPCASAYVEVSGSNPNLLSCGLGSFYVPWTSVNVDLTPYSGTNVTLRFTVAGCIYAGHYGYAYIDCSCGTSVLTVSDSLCNGNPVTISAPFGAASYNWTLGPPGGPSLGTNDSLPITAAGNYYVEMISVQGCTTLLNVNVGAYAQPTAAFSTTFAPCSLNYNFNNQSTVASGTLTYFWDFGDPVVTTDTSQLTSPSYTYPFGTYQVWLYVVASGGCSDSVSQFVSPGNGGLAAFTHTDVCEGNAMNFTDGSINPTNWSWHFGDTSTLADSSNVQNPVYTYPTAGTYTVTLTVNGSPCPSVYTSIVTVHAAPVSSFNYTAGCGNLTVNFAATSTISVGDAIGTYFWNFGDTASGSNTSSQANPLHAFTMAGTYTVTLTTTSTFGCQHTFTQVINVNLQPIASFTANPAFCTNVPIQFNNTSQNVASWWWNFGDPTVTSDTSLFQNPSYTYAGSGTYTVILIGEPSSACPDTSQLIITINSNPTITTSNPNTVCVNDGNYTLNGSPAGGTWSGTAVTSGMFSPVTAGNGTYALTYVYTDANGCTGTGIDTITVAPCTGINEQGVTMFSMFPNPASSGFTFNANIQGTMEMFDANGQLVMSKSITADRTEINTSEIATGTYLVRFTTVSGVISTGQLQIVR